MDDLSRRRIMAVASTGIGISIAGCGGSQNSGEANNQNEQESNCTDASIDNFNWDDSLLSEDSFTGTLINEGDVAGEVVISLEFWESEAAETLLGSVERTATIGAQATKDITIEANPPSDNTEWATMSVTQQDCQ